MTKWIIIIIMLLILFCEMAYGIGYAQAYKEWEAKCLQMQE